MIPLQDTVLGGLSPSGAYLVLLTLTLVATGMGLVIVFQAFRGYHRYGSRPMLYLAVGLALVTVAPFVLSVAATSIGPALDFGPMEYTYLLPIVTRLVQLAGLSCILYSLYSQA